MATQQPGNVTGEMPPVPGEDATAASVPGSGQGENGAGATSGTARAGGSLAAALPRNAAVSDVDAMHAQHDAVREATDADPVEPHPTSL